MSNSLAKRMEEVTKGVQPMVHGKNPGPGYMFSASGKSFNKNFTVFDNGKKDRKNLKSRDSNADDQQDVVKESNNVDKLFFDSYNKQQDDINKQKKLENKNKKFSEVEKSTKKKLENALGDMTDNNLEDDDRFLFYMESDLDKIRGTRKFAYLPKKQTGPPVGAYTPKYHLLYKRVTNVPKYITKPNYMSQSNIEDMDSHIKKTSFKRNKQISMIDNDFSQMLADDNDAEIMELKKSGSFLNKVDNLNFFLCPKDNCYSNQIAKMPSLTRNASSNISLLKRKSAVDIEKQLYRDQNPIDRKKSVNIFSDAQNYVNPQLDYNTSLPREKSKMVSFDQNMGREKKFRDYEALALNLDYDANYFFGQKGDVKYSIPKAKRDWSMHKFIKEDEMNNKKNIHDTNFLSISNTQFSKCKKIPDFTKMGDRNRPNNNMPLNLSELKKDQRRKRVNYKRKYYSSFVEIDTLLDEIKYVNDV